MQSTQQSTQILLTLNDLNDLGSFEQWLRKHINIFGNNKISYSVIEVYLSYLEEYIKNPEFEYERVTWLTAIQQLREAADKHERFKERNPKGVEEV
jgi:hypothetical protein